MVNNRPVLLIVLSIILAAGLLMSVRWRCLWRYVEAGFLLTDIADSASPREPGKSRPGVQRQQVVYQVQGRQRRADLYRWPGRVRAAVVLLPGVAEKGGEDPRLVAFAQALARARFAVLVPELAGLRQLRVSSADVAEVTDAVAWLSSRKELAPSGRAGLTAFSYAAGPAVLAALNESIRERVGFVFAVGGYYDLHRVLSYFTTGYYSHEGRQYSLPPDNYGKWAFVVGNIDRLHDAGDRRLLTALARRLQRNPEAVTQDLVVQLGCEGAALWRFVANRDPQLVPALLKNLPGSIKDELSALNLAEQNLAGLRAPLILIHGYEDAMIPFPESIALAGAVSGRRSRLYLVHGLMHVDVAPGLPDRWRLLRALRDLLAARDGDFPM